MKSTPFTLRHFLAKLTARLRKSEQSNPQTSHPTAILPESTTSTRPSPHERPPDPRSSDEAHTRLNKILSIDQALPQISYQDFMLGWVAMAYIAPGLNPDEAKTADGGWPHGWKLVAAEAFRRFEAKELTREELYPHPY
ncbi:MAG: hypothetical protein QNK82_00865 [Akkermansiaceae bacterium]